MVDGKWTICHLPFSPMRLTLLGTGTPAPSTVRQSSGYLVDVAGERARVRSRARRTPSIARGRTPGGRGRPTPFFTHLHYDHCLDYPRLVLQRWDTGAGRIPELTSSGRRRSRA